MRFSVVVPTYNRARLVFRTLETILAQSYSDFEAIVVDDGSTDDTPELFSRYRHPRVRYLRKENGERGAARNFGARHAAGEYLNFFDSDDLMLPHHLSEARRCVESYGRPEVFALGFRIEDARGRVRQKLDALGDPLNAALLRGNMLGCNPVFVRRDVFDHNPFDETRALAGSEDWLLWLRLAARYPFRFWPGQTSVLVDHEERSVFHFKEESLTARTEIMIARLKSDPEFMSRYGARLSEVHAFRHLYTGLHLALSGQSIRPLVYLLKAARTAPSSLFRRATLGTLKHALLSALGRHS